MPCVDIQTLVQTISCGICSCSAAVDGGQWCISTFCGDQRCAVSSQPWVSLLQNIFGGLAGLGSVAQVQLEWRRADGRPVATAAVRGRAGETDTLPVFSNKDSIVGDVSYTLQTSAAGHQRLLHQTCSLHGCIGMQTADCS